jgi:hypothetical protein
MDATRYALENNMKLFNRSGLSIKDFGL